VLEAASGRDGDGSSKSRGEREIECVAIPFGHGRFLMRVGKACFGLPDLSAAIVNGFRFVKRCGR
jgi:hypothetical protein